MSNGDASVQTGPELDADQEAQLQRDLATVYADEAEQAVEAIKEKIAGMQQTLKDKQAEAKRLRAEAKEAKG